MLPCALLVSYSARNWFIGFSSAQVCGAILRAALPTMASTRYDLSVSTDGGTAPAVLRVLEKFGYSAACLERNVAGRLTKGDACGLALPLRSTSEMRIEQLSRVTLAMELAGDAAELSLTSVAARSYDVVAVRPMSERVFALACEQMECDLISIDAAAVLPFALRQGLVEAAVKRGMYFEIVYSPALRDATARRHLISNALELVRATRGRNIVLSSGAADPMDIRGPHDVANLAMLFGLNEAAARSAVSAWPRAVLDRARERRRGAREGGVQCVAVAELPAKDAWMASAGGDGGGGVEGGGEGGDGGEGGGGAHAAFGGGGSDFIGF